MASIIQITPNGSGSATSPSLGFTATTGTVSFLSPTTAGNFILVVYWIAGSSSSGTISTVSPHPTPITVVGSTLSFSEIVGADWTRGNSTANGTSGVLYIQNAVSIPNTTTFTFTGQMTGSGAGPFGLGLEVEFYLIEVSGIATSAALDVFKNTAIGSASAPNAGSLTTTAIDLIISTMSADPTGSNISAGSGFTLGTNATVAVIGQNQYQLNVASGPTGVAFSGTEALWSAVAVAFKNAISTPILDVSPSTLSFSAVQGGSNPASQNISVSNGDGGTLSWSVASDESWLSGSPASGTNTGTVAASCNISGLTAGVYTGHLTFTATGATGSPSVVTVTLTISLPAPILSVVPLELFYTALPGGSNPASQNVVVSNVGVAQSMPYTAASDSSWLSVLPTSGDAGMSPQTLSVSVNIAGLSEGSFTGHILVTASTATGSPQTVTVILTIVDSFVYIKSFPITSGDQYTVALDLGGTLWSEHVTAAPFVLNPLNPTVIPGTRAFSTTQDDVEYFCFSDLARGTDIPRQYNPAPSIGGYTLDRISQVGPGAPPTFQATVAGSGTQATITSWAGSGSIVTFQAVNSFTAGEIIKLSGFAHSTFFNGLALQVLGAGLSTSQFEVQFSGYSGSTDTGVATPQFGYGIVSITQNPQESDPGDPGHFRALLWSAGVGTQSPGSTITVFYADSSQGEPQDTVLANQFNSGIPVYVYISNAPFGDGTQLVTSQGLYASPNGQSYWFFTFDALSVGQQFYTSDAATGYYQLSIATITTQQPIPGLAAGDQVTIAGVTPGGWNSPWAIVNVLNSGVYLITQTQMTGGTATYTWDWAGSGSPIAPLANQLVTVIQTLNGNGIFNVLDAPIATVTGGPSSGTFTIIGFNSPNISAAPESGQAQTAGTVFQFDPGQNVVGTTQSPIFGNAGAGGVISIVGSETAIGAGTRQAVVFFETRNGLKTFPSPYITFTTDVAATSITANNIPLGPPNVIRRWIAFTGAGPNGIAGPYYYTIDTPVTYTINNQTYLYTATYVDDNVSTSATFVFTDAVLLAGEEIDVQGNNLFAQIELGSAAWNVAYASRMFYGLEQNKVLNFNNLSFDGGYIPGTINTYPLGWGVDPSSNPPSSGKAATITAYAYNFGTTLTFTAANSFVKGQIVVLSGLSSPLTGLNGQLVQVVFASGTAFVIDQAGGGSGSITGTATLQSLDYGVTLQVSSVFGNSALFYNYAGTTLATAGMLTQGAYQDIYNVPIILPNTQYSVRVAVRLVSGVPVNDDLIIDLTQLNTGLISGTGTLTGYGITYGSFVLPLSTITGNMAIYTGTLLTTPFLTGVPTDLVLRIWGKNITSGISYEVDRFDVFPTPTPLLSTNIRVSYPDNFEAFDAETGNLGLASHNTQPCYGGFVLHDQLYFLQQSSMQSTQDIPGVEPSGPGEGWSLHEVSNRVGACGIYAYDYGEEWVLTACRNGLYAFNGGQPMRIDFQQKELWNIINWAAGNSIIVRNDLAERRILAAVPLPTPNRWLPLAPSNPTPTAPNVVLMWNYQGLDDFQELVSGRGMHTTMFGTLVSTDMRIKMSIWQIPTPYIGMITQPDLLTQLVTVCDPLPGQISQMSAAQLSDNGAAIPWVYSTFGFVNSTKAAQNPLLGFHRKRFSLLQTLIAAAVGASGVVKVQVFPNYILNPATLALNPSAWTVPGGIALQQQPPDDITRPLNTAGNRVYVVFSTNTAGAAAILSKLIMVGKIEELLTTNPNAG